MEMPRPTTKQQRRREVGYILLEECEVAVILDGGVRVWHASSSSSSLSPKPPGLNVEVGVWHDVDILNNGSAGNENTSASASSCTAGSGGSISVNGWIYDLVLRPGECLSQKTATPGEATFTTEKIKDSASNIVFQPLGEILPFNGILSEMKVLQTNKIKSTADENNNDTPSENATTSEESTSSGGEKNASDDVDAGASSGKKIKPRTRSDASLLAGLALQIHREGDYFEQLQSPLKVSENLHDGNHPNAHDNNGEEGELESSNFRYLNFERASIMLLEDIPTHDSRNLKSENEEQRGENDNSHSAVMMRASFLVTFSLPIRRGFNNSHQPNQQSHPNNKNALPMRTKSNKNKDKSLSPAFQLLASIIRCDWNHLDKKVEHIRQCALAERCKKMQPSLKEPESQSQNGASSPNSKSKRHNSLGKPPYFPNAMNLEELYERISGASKHFGSDMITNYTNNNSMTLQSSMSIATTKESATAPSNNSNTNDAIGIFHIPEEIISTSISSYLRARSLHALRSTNRKMYKMLQAVVPGLKLQLFQHQTRSLEWMQRRERRCITEAEAVRGRTDNNCNEGESACGGDYHRAITGGETVLLSPRSIRNNEIKHAQKSMRFHSQTGVEVDTPADDVANELVVNRFSRTAARGGLLCDDPGLGKTITVLSLVLRTFGLSTEPTQESPSSEVDDEAIFESYWKDYLTKFARAPAILKLITRLLKSDKESGYFVPPIKSWLDVAPDYYDVIENPISMQDIRIKYDKSDCADLKAFVADVKLCLSNAMVYNNPDDIVHKAAKRLSANFDELIAEFKRSHVNKAMKSITNISKQYGSSSLVGMLEAKKRKELEDPLVPSSSTLLVVPNPLLQHWQEQMISHIDFKYCSEGGWSHDEKMIYYHTSHRKKLATQNKHISYDIRDFVSGQPLIFIDDGSKQLPPATVLSRFRIVLTSYNRLTADWKFGSVEQELRTSNKNGGSNLAFDVNSTLASNLLKVHWLRLIVDEGHVMSKRANNAVIFGSWIAAERRWAMTGTPTPQVSNQSNVLRNVFHLSSFLEHDFCKRGREQGWNELISKGWTGGYMSSFYRLNNLLSYLMVRHTKDDLMEIAKPSFLTTRIHLSQPEQTTYNTLASGIRTNIITTSMEGKTSGWQDSLLNSRQSKHAAQALTNLRVACCGGLQILPQISNKHWSETLELLKNVHNLDEIKVQVVNNFIYRAQTGELSSCMVCGIQLQTLFVIPCGDLVCSECVDSKTKSCPVCNKQFDVDDFQRLQPGLVLEWRNNLEEEKNERQRKDALKRVISDSSLPINAEIDVEEMDALEPDVRPARAHRTGESCNYSARYGDGKCTVCRSEHYDCNFMQNKYQQCSICFKVAEECPNYATKAKYVIDKLLKLRSEDLFGDSSKIHNVSPNAARFFAKPGESSIHRPLKAIAFSQFQQIYEYFGDRLIRRFGGACVADYSYGGTRAEELQKFIHDPDCFVMLLSKQGSHGLDLSFCTHIFFLDTIYDKSLEDQVVARAWRMGATGSVAVEKLVAKDSIEEVMDKMNVRDDIDIVDSSDEKDKHAKLHTLLKSTKLIRPELERKKKRKLEGPIASKKEVDFAEQQNDHGEEKISKRAHVRFC